MTQIVDILYLIKEENISFKNDYGSRILSTHDAMCKRMLTLFLLFFKRNLFFDLHENSINNFPSIIERRIDRVLNIIYERTRRQRNHD